MTVWREKHPDRSKAVPAENWEALPKQSRSKENTCLSCLLSCTFAFFKKLSDNCPFASEGGWKETTTKWKIWEAEINSLLREAARQTVSVWILWLSFEVLPAGYLEHPSDRHRYWINSYFPSALSPKKDFFGSFRRDFSTSYFSP